jgi:hypothetical protein
MITTWLGPPQAPSTETQAPTARARVGVDLHRSRAVREGIELRTVVFRRRAAKHAAKEFGLRM